MAIAPDLDFAAFVARKRNERVNGALAENPHDYSYISDKQTRAAFERMRPVELVIGSSVRAFKQVWRHELLGHSVKVSERQFPRIQAIVKQCATTLDIAMPSVYIVNNPTLNAATYGTNDDSFIMVHSALIDHFTDDELLTVIGHECGHIHNHHVVYLTALHYLTRMAGVFVKWAVEPALMALRAWSRRAEITCDRAGMLCGKNVHTATHALTKLALGSQRLYDDFNMEAFLEQYDEGKAGMGKYMEMFASHPWLPKRVLAMRTFGESALYRQAAGLGAGGLTMKEVDDKVLALLKGDA
ncbi:MAG: M48 family metallopeptidase [Polyangiaceae bacterium]